VIKGRVPDAHADFIFAVAGEEYGTIFCMLLVLAFVFIFMRGCIRVLKQENLFVMYATLGLMMEFALQSIINMGVAINLIPNTGMTLPLVSYGGSSTFATAISLGMVLSLTRRRYGEIGY
jgi:cell division protein FtsW